MNKKIIWIDVETTDLNPKKGQIIELAAIYETKNEREIFHKYCKPKVKPETYAKTEELTGITWEKLEECGVTEEYLYKSFKLFLNSKISPYNRSDKAIFAAYNASFDKNWCCELFKKHGDNYFFSFFYSAHLDIWSTVGQALRLGVIPALSNYKNVTIAEHLGVKLENAHSAIEDIKASRGVQLELEKRMGLKVG